MQYRIPALLLTSLLGFASAAQAAEIRGTGGLGFEFGGDDLLQVTYYSGETASISAGDGFYLNVGGITSLDEAQMVDAALTIGWKYTSVQATNGEASLSRFPIDAMLYYRPVENHRFGGGLTKHIGIKYSGSGALSDVGADLESDVGFLLSYEYVMGQITLGARYVNLDYRATDYNATVDAGSLGFTMAALF